MKFNEAKRAPKTKPSMPEDAITWSEMLERIQTEDVKLINSDYKSFEELITVNNLENQFVNYNSSGGCLLYNGTSTNMIGNGYGNSIVVIYDDDGLPEAVVPMSNPYVLPYKNIIMISNNTGRDEDSIICYDKITGNSISRGFA